MNNNKASELQAFDPMSQQKTFRLLMQAFSYPGRVVSLCHLNQSQEACSDNVITGVLATLIDNAVRFYDATGKLKASTLQKLELQISAANKAQFILAEGKQVPDFTPHLGSLEEPEFGATVIVQVEDFQKGASPWQLQGPGIATQQTLHVQGLHPEWLKQRSEWNCGFPMGVDVLLVSKNAIVALPRTIQIKTEATWAM
jgi:alpha-D-ribose 1-methylphosphonate 5-triphosphate synthase subunit PhnH